MRVLGIKVDKGGRKCRNNVLGESSMMIGYSRISWMLVSMMGCKFVGDRDGGSV
jgi:hypothetical protein